MIYERDARSTLWMVQTNLGNRETHDAIKSACERNSLPFNGVAVIPFLNEVPDLTHDGPVLAYGATKFIKNVVDSKKWNPGAFFDESEFTLENCGRKWGNWMVNADSVITPLRSVSELAYQDSQDVFVRPNDDLKAFAGEVMTFRELCDWATGIDQGRFEIDGALLVAVARPKRIAAEWRVFAVGDGDIVAATRYRLDGRLAPQPGAPAAVRSFVETRLAEWMPAPAIALDIAEVDGELRVLELSNIHSAGHYAADVESIIVETSRVAESLFR